MRRDTPNIGRNKARGDASPPGLASTSAKRWSKIAFGCSGWGAKLVFLAYVGLSSIGFGIQASSQIGRTSAKRSAKNSEVAPNSGLGRVWARSGVSSLHSPLSAMFGVAPASRHGNSLVEVLEKYFPTEGLTERRPALLQAC